jgi:hypothetical protein
MLKNFIDCARHQILSVTYDKIKDDEISRACRVHAILA